MTEHSAKCGGACCRRFHLPYSPDQLRAAFHAWYTASEWIDEGDARGIPVDIHLVAPMVRDPELSKIDILGGETDPAWYYSCVHHSAATGLCEIYEMRPHVCRIYNPSKCRYPGCRATRDPDPDPDAPA